MSISSLVRQALQVFLSMSQQSAGKSAVLEAAFHDEQGRFKMWAANIAAHRPNTSRKSLEYRLRDSSELSLTVVSLLNDLLTALRALQVLTREDGFLGHDEADGSKPANVTATFELIEEALDEIHEVNSCLLRFTMTLQNPARSDQIKQNHAGSDMTQYYQSVFEDHVRNKFPHAPDYLAHRISMVIAKHKSYFKYREEHHNKLKEDLDKEKDDKTDRPSTVATSIEFGTANDSSDASAGLDDSASEDTATSYAPSRSGDVSLRPPPLPDAGAGGEIFECPICYGLISVHNTHKWLQHVFDDIPPYICTSRECSVANRPFPRRKDWIRHQKEHNRAWSCPYGCKNIFKSLELFDKHLKKSHGRDMGSGILKSLASVHSIPDEDRAPRSCPLCLVDLSAASEKSAARHVGRHFTQLALFALTEHHLVAGDEEKRSTGSKAHDKGDYPRLWGRDDFHGEESAKAILDGQNNDTDSEGSTDFTFEDPQGLEDTHHGHSVLSLRDAVFQDKGHAQLATASRGRLTRYSEESMERPSYPIMGDLEDRFMSSFDDLSLEEPQVTRMSDNERANLDASEAEVQDNTLPLPMDWMSTTPEKSVQGAGVQENFAPKSRLTTLSTKADVKHHLETHQTHELRPYRCSACQQRFRYPKDLVRHVQTHEADAPRHYCPAMDCRFRETGFVRLDHLRRHMRTQHGWDWSTQDTTVSPDGQDAQPTTDARGEEREDSAFQDTSND